MKKIKLLAIAFVAISFASCKKDRVCTCTDVDGDVLSTTYYDSKKSNAELLCTSENSQTKFTSGGVTITGDRTTCVLE